MTPFVKDGKTHASHDEYVKWLETEKERLETTVKNHQLSKPRQVELRIEHETGFVQIRRLSTQHSVLNIPVWELNWLFEHAGDVLKFIKEHGNLLTGQNDAEEILSTKLAARAENLGSENPVVRKPRAEPKPKPIEA